MDLPFDQPLPIELRQCLRLAALRHASDTECRQAASSAWASLPHQVGESVVVEYRHSPGQSLDLTMGSSIDHGLDSVLAGLEATHEFELVPTNEGPLRPFSAGSLVVLSKRRVPLSPADPQGGSALLAPFGAGFSDAALLTQVLQKSSEPVCIRFVVTATELTTGEEDVVLSSLSDPDASELTRLIRRAEGARTRATELFRLLPPFEVGVFVAAPGEVRPAVISSLCAVLGADQPSDPLSGYPDVRILGADDVQGTGFNTGRIRTVDGDDRLSRIFGPGELHTAIRLPFATTATFPALTVRRSHLVRRAARRRPGSGLHLGWAETGGGTQEVRLAEADMSRHLFLSGQTGTGKSRLMESLALQEAEAGGGFAFIDPHGDSVDRLVERMPGSRLDDVVVLDPSSPSGRLAVNPLEADTTVGQEFVVQDLGEMFYALFDPTRSGIVGPRFEAWLRMGALTLLDAARHGGPSPSLIDIPRLFSDDEFLKARFAHTRDSTVQDFWINEMGSTSDYHKSEMLGWFTSKFSRFATNEIIREMLGSGRNDLDLAEIMDHRRILLVRLPKGLIGEVNASLLGYVLTTRMWVAALNRAGAPASSRTPFTLYVDEFQNFTSAGSLDAMLSEARKFGLRLVLANQFQSQLPGPIIAAVNGNVANRITFRVGAPDAALLAPLYAGSFTPEDLVYLPNLTAAATLLDRGEVQPPFTLRTACS